ncbi:hypothetical protein ACRCJW_01395 [Aerococcus urinaeequi]|uniref:hypothetical protein n=1 Tax=Aerococcus TaxID=1375 RepID=UPI00036B44C7|nr:hypothetical protein [Aerococcus viridans]
MQKFFRWINKQIQDFQNGFPGVKFFSLFVVIVVIEWLFISYFNSKIQPFFEDVIITSGNQNIIELAFETVSFLIIVYLIILPISIAVTLNTNKDTFINQFSNKTLEMCIEIFKDIFIAGFVGASAYIVLNTL